MFSKWYSSKRITRQRSANYRPRLEGLEERLVLSAFTDLANAINSSGPKSILSEIKDGVDGLQSSMTAKLPIVDQSLSELLFKNNNPTAINEIKNSIDQITTTLQQITDPNTAQSQLETAISGALSTGTGAKVTAKVNLLDAVDPIIITLNLDKVYSLASTKFGLGIAGMPLQASGAFNLDASFGLHDFSFGLAPNGAGDPSSPSGYHLFSTGGKFTVALDAGLDETSQITGHLGFLEFHVTNNVANVPPTHLGLAFSFDIDPSQGFSNPQLNGNAIVNMHILAEFNGAQASAPSIQADLHLDWNFFNVSSLTTSDHSFGDAPNVSFNNVEIELGSYIEHLVGPTIQKIQQLTAPVKDFFEFLGKPIPGISDLAKLAGKSDGVSLLDVAGIASSKAPEPYSLYISMGKTFVEIVNDLNKVQSGLDSNTGLKATYINLGDFTVASKDNTKDIRDLVNKLGDDNFSDWSDLQASLSKIDAKPIEAKITEAADSLENDPNGPAHVVAQGINTLIDRLKNALQPTAFYTLTYPLIDDPINGAFGLLLGRDADFVNFDAEIHLPKTNQQLFGFDVDGFHVGLTSEVGIDAKLNLGYDTRGLRHIATDALKDINSIDVTKALDGFWVSTDTHFTVTGDLALSAGFSYVVVSASITGSVNVGFNASIDPKADGDISGEMPDGKVHLDEFEAFPNQNNGNQALIFAAHADAAVDVDIKFGVTIPLVGFLGAEKSVTLAKVTLFNIDTSSTNPFSPPVNFDPASNINGILFLKPTGQLDPDTLKSNDRIDVYHAAPEDGDPAGTEAVWVSTGGNMKRYSGVTKIVREAPANNSGNDHIVIGEGVTVDAELHGGAGDDDLQYLGTGTAYLYGDDGNDQITGGLGNNFLYGNSGEDVLQGGLFSQKQKQADPNWAGKSNFLDGGDGNDTLYGGSSPSILHGGNDNDILHGGESVDHLFGDFGNDTLYAGIGIDSLDGGRGDDTFVWGWHSPPNNGEGLGSYDDSVEIQGGGGNDTFRVEGAPSDEAFLLAKYNPNFGGNFDVALTGPNNSMISLKDVENYSIEGNRGADSTRIADLTNTSVQNVAVNTGDVIKNVNNLGDQAQDHVIVDGTTGADKVTISAEDVVIQDDGAHGIHGGLTKFTGLATYTVHVANVQDDVRYYAHQGTDTSTITGITGPTKVFGESESPEDNASDTFNVIRNSPNDFLDPLNIEAGKGDANQIHVKDIGFNADTMILTSTSLVSSQFSPISFVATGGKYSQVSLDGSNSSDSITIKETLASAVTTVNGNGGDDTILVQSGAGDLSTILGPLNIDTGAGANNTLTLDDSSATQGNQNVVITNSQVTGFVGPIDATSFTYKSTGGKLAMTLNGSSSANLSEHFTLTNPGASINAFTNGGPSLTTINSLSLPANIFGGAGNDIVNVCPSTSNLNNLQGALQFIGGGGLDILTVDDSSPALAGKIYNLDTNSLARSNAGSIGFDGSLEKLFLSTTNSNDQINFANLPSPSQLTLNAGGGQDTLTGPTRNNLWDIEGVNTGFLDNKVAFSNVESLIGGTLDDRFLMMSSGMITSKIDGSTGNDTLDYSFSPGPVVANLQMMSASNVSAVLHIESLVGSSSANDTLTGTDAPNVWQINSANAGILQTLTQGNITFSSFENLTGGQSSDVFYMNAAGSVSGLVHGGGGAGIDRLDYSNRTTDVHVDLSANTATSIGGGVTKIVDVTGGAGNDILRGNALNNRLDGGSGNDFLLGENGVDILIGGLGNDILVGGAGADQLNGGAGEDILIAGSLSQQASTDAALLAVMAEWSNTQETYTVRRNFLLNGGGLNHNNRISSNEIIDDAGNNVLIGGTETDWFWAQPSKGDQLPDRNPLIEKLN